MSTITFLALFLLIGANAAALVAAVVAIVRLRQSMSAGGHSRAELPVAGATRRASANERQQMLINLRTERLLKSMQRQLNDLAADDRNLKAVLDRPLPIDNAIRMAKSGASVEELTRSCGLNAGEAQLMHKLHCKAETPPPAETFR